MLPFRLPAPGRGQSEMIEFESVWDLPFPLIPAKAGSQCHMIGRLTGRPGSLLLQRRAERAGELCQAELILL